MEAFEFVWDAWWPGGLMLAVLAALMTWVWRRTGEPGLSAIALALALCALIFLVKNPLLQDFGDTSWPGLAMAGAAGVAMATGMCLYTGTGKQPLRDAARLASAWVLVSMVLHLTDVAAPLTAHLSLALLMLTLVTMAWNARRREPGIGFGFVAAAFLVQPVVVGLGWLMGLPEGRVRLWTWVPFAIAGTTLLVVGLLRAHTAVSRELNARRAAEQALREANEALEARVAERTNELREMVAGLESFNRTVAHDLRGPIGGIKGLADLCQTLVREGRTERALEMLQLMSRQGQLSIDLVAALMQYTQARQSPLKLGPVDLGRIVRDAIEIVHLARGNTEGAKIDVGPLPVEWIADEALIRQVFVNLIGNALKFSSASPSPRVTVTADCSDVGVRIEVADNGVGFDSDSADVFEPFLRLHGHAFEGSGIGLSIVRGIVLRHGGQVGCSSRPGQGATFWFWLPIRPSANM